MIFQLIYSSRACNKISHDEVEKILSQSMESNVENNITGILLYIDGVFLQILEGEESDVLGLANRIEADSRHSEVKIIAKSEVEGRIFNNWAMAYVDIDKEKLANWLEIDGTVSIDEVIQNIELKANIFPDYIKHIFTTVASD